MYTLTIALKTNKTTIKQSIPVLKHSMLILKRGSPRWTGRHTPCPKQGLICTQEGEAALSIADRQNTHSASMAVNAIFQLFRTVSRQKELDKEILAFSVSHNYTVVKIYSHFPLVHSDNNRPSSYRRNIHSRNIWDEDDEDRWSSCNIIRKTYDEWILAPAS